MNLEQIIKQYHNEAVTLRKPNQAKIEEYKEKLLAGVSFPEVILGTWPKDEKYGEQGIVDGYHRLGAYQLANEALGKSGGKQFTSIPYTIKKFETLSDALYFMYQANMAHGLPVGEGSRNERMRLLKKLDPKLDWQKMAAMFKLSKATVFRILGDEEGKIGEKPGRKAGTKVSKSQAHKTLDPLKPSAFYKTLERVNATLSKKRTLADIVAYATPETKEGVKVDSDKVEAIQECLEALELVAKGIEEADK